MLNLYYYYFLIYIIHFLLYNEFMIAVSNFTKMFGEKMVVSDLSFDVREGEIFAFLGANGSGKTTTIRCLLDIYQPTSGTLFIQGKPFNTSMSNLIGYLPEERGLYKDARVLETLVYFGQIKGLDKAEASKRALEFLEWVELGDKTHAEIKTLSSGQQQKVQLGIAIINKPKLMILDEPTKGLDPLNRDILMESLFELNKQGSTIMFISHQMEEVEKIAHRILMIKDGKKILYGPLEQIKKGFGGKSLHEIFVEVSKRDEADDSG